LFNYHKAHGNADPSTEELVKIIERFIILMYDKASNFTDIIQARKVLFARKGRPSDKIPPTRGSLVQHMKRAMLQTIIWGQALLRAAQHPSPIGWGLEDKKANLQLSGQMSPYRL